MRNQLIVMALMTCGSVMGQEIQDIAATAKSNSAAKAEKQLVCTAAEPSAEVAKTARGLIEYFCRQWQDENYGAMYMAMTPKYRQEISFGKFCRLLEEDAERTGGLKFAKLLDNDVDEGKYYSVSVGLFFNFARANGREVQAVLEKVHGSYRVKDSGIIPVDFKNL